MNVIELVGITTFSLITAMLASQLTVASSPKQLEMAGHRIGTLKHRTYDTVMIAMNGGIATEAENIGVMEICSKRLLIILFILIQIFDSGVFGYPLMISKTQVE